MTIPSVMQGLIELEDGKVFELDSPKGSMWLESVTSFRFEPTSSNKPYTVRKESGKGGDYWYGYRKMAGKLHKKYIGKSSELSTAKLEEVAEVLNTPSQPRVTEKVTEKVADKVADRVTQSVVSAVTDDRLTTLELQLATLVKAVEALQEALPGKSESGDSQELPKVDNEVTDSELQIELGNLRDENEALRAELAEVRSQLATVQTTPSVTISPKFYLPETADMLNKLKAKRKKSKADLGDVIALWEILEDSCLSG
ncbi:hypothetical protein [Microcoleus sp.]|uniref:hypothetical protein n=1 Tax=Microcoleus sp. TaxID=44472 RepID=UPI00352564DC